MTIFLFQSTQIEHGFKVMGACFAAGVPSMALLVLLIVATTVLMRRKGAPSQFRRWVGIAGTALSFVIALIVPIAMIALLIADHVRPLRSILETVALLWIPPVVLSIPAAVQSIRLAIKNKREETF
jgi:hypothetical protein